MRRVIRFPEMHLSFVKLEASMLGYTPVCEDIHLFSSWLLVSSVPRPTRLCFFGFDEVRDKDLRHHRREVRRARGSDLPR